MSQYKKENSIITNLNNELNKSQKDYLFEEIIFLTLELLFESIKLKCP